MCISEVPLGYLYALRQHHVPQNPLTAYDFISRSVFSSPVFRDALHFSLQTPTPPEPAIQLGSRGDTMERPQSSEEKLWRLRYVDLEPYNILLELRTHQLACFCLASIV